MNPFLVFLQQFLLKNGAASLLFITFVLIGAVVGAQTVTQRQLENSAEHNTFKSEIAQLKADNQSIHNQFNAFRDEIRIQMAEINTKLTRLLTLAEKNDGV